MSEDALSLNDRFTVNLGRLTISFPLWLWAAAVLLLIAVAVATFFGFAHHGEADTVSSTAQVWTDSKTGLTWTLSDNGVPVNWSEAIGYCKSLSLEAKTDWRVPASQDLTELWEKKKEAKDRALKTYRLGKGFRLTDAPYLWSSTVDGPGYGQGATYAQVYFAYNEGGIGNLPLAQKDDNGRVICVRGALR